MDREGPELSINTATRPRGHSRQVFLDRTQYSAMWRRCLTQEHNTWCLRGLNPLPVDLESDASPLHHSCLSSQPEQTEHPSSHSWSSLLIYRLDGYYTRRKPYVGVPRKYCAASLDILIFAYALKNYFFSRSESLKSHHDKTSKIACAPFKDSDQPWHPPSVIRVFAVSMKKAWVLSHPLSGHQPRLICLRWATSILLVCREVAHISILIIIYLSLTKHFRF